MKPKDILKLAVQLLGLVLLYHGLQALPVAVIQFCTAVPSMNIGSMFTSLVLVAWPLAVAYWLLCGASLIMRIAYADTPATTMDETKIGGVFGQKADV